MLQASQSTSSGHSHEPARVPGAYDELVLEIGEDGAGEVRTVFWSDTDARLKLLRDLTLAEQRARIGREAHSLKSAARTFGYLRLAALAQQLEQDAAMIDEAAHGALVEAMDAAYAAARAQEG